MCIPQVIMIGVIEIRKKHNKFVCWTQGYGWLWVYRSDLGAFLEFFLFLAQIISLQSFEKAENISYR